MGSLHLVTGKGGVGKTRFSLLLSSQLGGCPIAEKADQIRNEAQKMNLPCPEIFKIESKDLLEDFLISVLKVKKIAQFASQSKLLQNLVQVAPNLDEIALFKKWISLSANQDLVVDAPSTGNLLGIFDAIKTAEKMFEGGLLRQAADDIDQALNLPNRVFVYAVSLPENSALEEMTQIKQHLHQLYPNLECRLVLNRLHECPEDLSSIPEAYHDIATKRPELEKKRIEAFSFWRVIQEGETK